MNRGNVIHRLRFRIGDPIAESVDCNSAIFKTGKPRSIDRGSRGREGFAKSIVRIYIYIYNDTVIRINFHAALYE